MTSTRSHNKTAAPRSPGRPRDAALASRRRHEILPCAIRYFAQSGYHAADMDQIASALGCAKGTLYRYFSSKQDLFEAAVDHVMQQLLEQNAFEPSNDLVADMTRSLTSTLAFFDEHPLYVELLLLERSVFKDRPKPSFFEFCEADHHNWSARLTQGVRDGIIRDIPIATIRHIGVTLIYGAIFTNYFTRDQHSYEAQANQINQIFLHGILNPPGSSPRKPRKPRKRRRPHAEAVGENSKENSKGSSGGSSGGPKLSRNQAPSRNHSHPKTKNQTASRPTGTLPGGRLQD